MTIGLLVLASAAGAATPPPPPVPVSPPPEEPPSRAPAPEGKQEEPPQGLLAGPKVENHDGEAQVAPFGAGRPLERLAEVKVRPRRWLAIFLALDLDEEQRRAAAEISDEVKRLQREFMREHGRDVRELRRALAEAREARRRPSEEQQARLRALDELRPKIEPHQAKLWDLLTPSQQEAFQGRLTEEKERIAERRSSPRTRGSRAPSRQPSPEA
jgi:hypothetical protein